jgi:septal ring factor EnvC (AmiA/AmiB activator)
MKSQIMNKEEEVENLEEEVVTLRSKIVKFSKNAEDIQTSILVIENEENHPRLLEKTNEENRKSYAELLKGRNHGQPKSKKTIEDHLQEDHPCSSHKEGSIMIMINQGRNS